MDGTQWVVVPSLTISLFLTSDLIYYAKNINFTSGVGLGMSCISQLLKSGVGKAARVSIFYKI